MRRRAFLGLGVGSGLAGVSAAAGKESSEEASMTPPQSYTAPTVLSAYTAEDHRHRLQSIGFCERAVKSCMRKHLVTSYLPAQACYNLGEYPSQTRWEPSEYDEQELDRLRDHGIQLIQLFDDWNDSLRLFGGHKLKAVNPDGFRRFVEMIHQRDMKVIGYISSGFLQRTDPDFRPEWSREGDFLSLGYWNMARCAPSSAGWRAYLLPRVMEVLDEYGLDGLYNDCGYVTNARKRLVTPTTDEVTAFEETPEYDGALTDILALLYAEVKRRGGIVKVHIDAADAPMAGGEKVYDYLWVGEGVNNTDLLRERVKNHPPYVVPCVDMTFATTESRDEPYLHAIPYMQFPVIQVGRPFTGERASVPGVTYSSRENDFWMKRCKDIWKYYQAHPDGPYVYGGWDTFPPCPEDRPLHAQWLKRYMPLIEEGTRAWLEVGESTLFAEALPKDAVASLFANREVYLVLANYGHEPVEVATEGLYVSDAEPSASPRKTWRLKGRSLEILKATNV